MKYQSSSFHFSIFISKVKVSDRLMTDSTDTISPPSFLRSLGHEKKTDYTEKSFQLLFIFFRLLFPFLFLVRNK